MNGAGASVDLGKLRDVEVPELAIRFAFGAGISTVAALVSVWMGARIGGAFLAFPAILPATVTLIAQDESDEAADETAVGAAVGAPGMTVFAGTVAGLATVIGTGLVLGAATALWAATVAVLFVLSLRLPVDSVIRWVAHREPDESVTGPT